MIRARKIDPREIEAALKRSRDLRSQAFADLGASLARGLRRVFRALSHAPASGKGRSSPVAGSVGWL